MLNPDPINAHESLAKIPGDGETTLDWRPAYAGISRSGDFGFTTGPFLIRGLEGVVGHYFTVWRLQSDGTWKWIFDAGTDVVDTSPVALNEDIPGLPVATTGAATPQAAVADIAELEAKHTSSATLVKAACGRHARTPALRRTRHRHRRGRSAPGRRRRDELRTAAARGRPVGRYGLLDGRGPRPARGRRASALLRANLAATPGRLADRFRRDRPATRLSGLADARPGCLAGPVTTIDGRCRAQDGCPAHLVGVHRTAAVSRNRRGVMTSEWSATSTCGCSSVLAAHETPGPNAGSLTPR